MDGVDVKEISRLTLPTVQSENCMSWSEDHKLSCITNVALHIVEVSPNPSEASSEMCLQRTVIKPSQDTPTSNSGIKVNDLFWLLGQRNVYRLVLDTKLAPRLDDTKPLETHFIAAQWSPARMYQDHRCMIATLTDLGSLKLNVPYFKSWVEVADLSQLWVDHWVSLWPKRVFTYNRFEADDTFTVLEERTSQLKITAIVWGDLIENPENGKYSLMASISHSGSVGIWKVDHLIDLGNPLEKYKPCLLTTYNTELHNASSLHWFNWNENTVALVIGDPDGYIKMLTFNYNPSDKKITNLSLKDIWNEKDKIKISLIKSISSPPVLGKERRIIAVNKSSYFLVILISQDEVISSCFHRTGGLSITGFDILNNHTFIACTLSGNLFKLSVNVNEADINSVSLICNALTSNTSWNEQACFGICCSHNKHLWSLGTNLCKSYDHLVIRRPGRIIFTYMCGMEDPLEILKKSQNPIQPTTCLNANWESIELMRMHQIKLQKTQGSKTTEYAQEVDNFSLTQLQLELWRSRIFVTHLLTTDVLVQNPEACAYVTLLEELILCRHACKFIDELLKSSPLTSTDEDSLQIAFLLRLWLQVWLSHNSIGNVNKSTTDGSPDTSHKSEANGSPDTSQKSKTDNNMESNDSLNVHDSQVCGAVTEALESVMDDAVSVGSFDDATSTDSNSSYCVSGNKVQKKLQLQQGKIPSSFLNFNMQATHNLVTSILSISQELDGIGKEICVFCEQDITMDIDFRFGTCPANHRLPRCCLCLRQCVETPYRLCTVCPAVACLNQGCNIGTFCTFCDSPLVIDDKFKKDVTKPQSEETKT